MSRRTDKNSNSNNSKKFSYNYKAKESDPKKFIFNGSRLEFHKLDSKIRIEISLHTNADLLLEYVTGIY